MCTSLNVPRSGEPRCPLVPKLTSWLGSSKSGRRSKYSFSRRATSTSNSFGAGLPASDEMLGSPVLGSPVSDCVSKLPGMVPPSRSRLRIAQRSEYSWFVAAEVVGENEVQRSSSLGFIFIVRMRVVPGAAILDLLHCEPDQKHVLFTGFLRHFDGRTVAGSNR